MKNIKIIVFLLVIVIGLWFLFKYSASERTSDSKELIPVNAISHGHGLAVDLLNPEKVYIATHHGLLLFESGKLYQVGQKRDDYMGFQQHPTDSNVFYASGHPLSGGNIGFQKSIDGGFSWQKISNGVEGPVDFHAMAISPADPNYVYGWYQGSVQRSVDGGKNFEIVNKNILAVQLVADAEDPKKVYAANPAGGGILVSRDAGVTFSSLSADLSGGGVSGMAVDPKNAKHMLVYSEKIGGLAESSDSGLTWKKVPASFDGTILFISFFRNDPKVVYALAHSNSLYKSTDSGSTWNLLVEGQK